MIAAHATEVSMEIEGLAGMEQRFSERIKAQLPRETVFEVHTGGARGAAKNALIAAVQAGHDRNAFYVNPRVRKLIVDATVGLASTVFSVRRAAEETIKNLLLVSIGENVQAQRNPGGVRFRSLTANYAAAKRRKFGFVVPILKATGDLLGGLKVRISRQ